MLLIYRRNRLGWVAGAASSIYLRLSGRRARICRCNPALQFYYVAMAIYGWRNWTRAEQQEAGGIGRWPLRYHAVAVVAICRAERADRRSWLAREHARGMAVSSTPMTTWTSLFATWLLARLKLENWLYWIVGGFGDDLYVRVRRGYPLSAGLFLSYMVIAVFGFREWLRKLPPAERLSAPPAWALARVPGLERWCSRRCVLARARGRQRQPGFPRRYAAGAFVLRLNGAAWRRPGVDRKRELALHRAAATAGIAPPIVARRPGARWPADHALPARTRSGASTDYDDVAALHRLGERLQVAACAGARPTVAPFDPWSMAQDYLRQIRLRARGAGTGRCARWRRCSVPAMRSTRVRGGLHRAWRSGAHQSA